MDNREFAAVVFDKDGTILDFERTWTAAADAALRAVASDDQTLRELADVLGFDLERQAFQPAAPMVSMSNGEVAELASSLVDGWALVESLGTLVLDHVTPAPHADVVLRRLRADGVRLAVATNDAAESTELQIAAVGWTDVFEVVVGFDSGHGSKPGPGMVLHAMAALGVDARATAMVGDSEADLLAARSAGVTAILVGPDPTHRALADLHVGDLGELLDLLG